MLKSRFRYYQYRPNGDWYIEELKPGLGPESYRYKCRRPNKQSCIDWIENELKVEKYRLQLETSVLEHRRKTMEYYNES